MAATDIQVVTGGDAFILTNPTIEKRVNIFNPSRSLQPIRKDLVIRFCRP